MIYLLSNVLTVLLFVLLLFLFKIKTFTMHVCMVRAFWRFECFSTGPTDTVKDRIHTTYLGPVAFVVVR